MSRKSKKETFKYTKLVIIYAIIIVLSFALSVICQYAFKWASISEFFLCFVGISGTAASLYSIYVSAHDEIRANKESEESQAFLNDIKKTVGFVLSNTEDVKQDVKSLLGTHSDSNIAETKDKQTNNNKANGNWEKPHDENPPA